MFFQLRGSQKGEGSAIWEKFPKNTVFFLELTPKCEWIELKMWRNATDHTRDALQLCADVKGKCIALKMWKNETS